MADQEKTLTAAEQLLLRGSLAQNDEALLDPERDKVSDPKPKRVNRTKGTGTVDNKTRPGKQTARTNLTEDLQTMFASFAMPLYAFSAAKPELAYDAHIILTNAPKMAEQLNDLAQRNPVVHRVLFAMMNGTDTMALTVTLSQVAVPILANHGVIPKATAGMFGAPDPEEFLENPASFNEDAA